jgi:signal transduction histidine kinase
MVRDSGPGVPPELRERIFEPFVSGRAGAENAGLGLYVCHEIVTHNGGSLRLAERGDAQDDGDGDGATFYLSLPPAPEAIEEAASPRRALRSGA